jgi:hypothetical protein
LRGSRSPKADTRSFNASNYWTAPGGRGSPSRVDRQRRHGDLSVADVVIDALGGEFLPRLI